MTVNNLTFSYDANGNELTADNSAGDYTMSYDKLNRMTVVQEPFGLTLTYAFDAVGNETQVSDSFAGILTSAYDADNNLTLRNFSGTSQTPLEITLSYSARNQVTAESRFSTTTGTAMQLVGSSAYSYDSRMRVTNIQHANGSSTNLANYTYAYDNASRLTQETDNGTSVTYGYDADSELTNAGSTLYAYDQNGNRTMTGYTTGTGNELTNDGTWTYTYDKNGSMTEKSMGASSTTWYYSYNNQNQMTGATEYTKPSGGTLEAQATYVYDALANRVEVDEWTSGAGSTTVTRFGYDGSNVWVDLNSSNQLQMRHLYLNGVDQIFAREDSSGNVAWYLTDHLGSIRIVVNSADTTTDVVAYDAFGNYHERVECDVWGSVQVHGEGV